MLEWQDISPLRRQVLLKAWSIFSYPQIKFDEIEVYRMQFYLRKIVLIVSNTLTPNDKFSINVCTYVNYLFEFAF